MTALYGPYSTIGHFAVALIDGPLQAKWTSNAQTGSTTGKVSEEKLSTGCAAFDWGTAESRALESAPTCAVLLDSRNHAALKVDGAVQLNTSADTLADLPVLRGDHFANSRL